MRFVTMEIQVVRSNVRMIAQNLNLDGIALKLIWMELLIVLSNVGTGTFLITQTQCIMRFVTMEIQLITKAVQSIAKESYQPGFVQEYQMLLFQHVNQNAKMGSLWSMTEKFVMKALFKEDANWIALEVLLDGIALKYLAIGQQIVKRSAEIL